MIVAGTIILAGCQMPGRMAEKSVCPLCPECHRVTTTGIIKGTTVTSVYCPCCNKQFEDSRLLEYRQPEDLYYSCEKCRRNYRKCENCQKKQDSQK